MFLPPHRIDAHGTHILPMSKALRKKLLDSASSAARRRRRRPRPRRHNTGLKGVVEIVVVVVVVFFLLLLELVSFFSLVVSAAFLRLVTTPMSAAIQFIWHDPLNLACWLTIRSQATHERARKPTSGQQRSSCLLACLLASPSARQPSFRPSFVHLCTCGPVEALVDDLLEELELLD